MTELTDKMDKIMDNLCEDHINQFFKAKFPYVMTKANSYLEDGPEKTV